MSKNFINKLIELKEKTGNHSPSISEIINIIGYDPVKVDACFLSNPYATKIINNSGIFDLNQQEIYKLIEAYPPSQDYLLERLSNIEPIKNENTLITNGAQHAIEILMSTLNYKQALLPIPTFSSYYEAVNKTSDMNYLKLEEEEGFMFNFSKLEIEIEKKNIDLLILITPNNPTGTEIEYENIFKLSTKFPELKIIVDESFSHFSKNYESNIIKRRKLLDNVSNVFCLKSLSKDFGVAGLRIGYVESKNDVLRSLRGQMGTWVLNNFAVRFLDYIASKNFLKEYAFARNAYLKDLEEFQKCLSNIEGFTAFHSAANFALLKIDNASIDSQEFAFQMLVEDGVYIRSMNDKIGLSKSFLRVACRTKEENKKIFNALRKRIK